MAEQLTIALDGTPLAGPLGGIQRFCTELHAALATTFPQDSYSFLSDQLPPFPTGLARKWWAYGLNGALSKLKADLFHGTDFAVPYVPRRPSVMTIHDLSPWRFPSAANERVRTRTEWLLRLRIPTCIHTPSETVRQEVIQHFSWPADRVHAIPLAPATHFRPTPLPNQSPYLLYVGTVEPRKNLPVLVLAFRLLAERHPGLELWIAGNPRPGYQLSPQPGIRQLGPVPEADLPGLYSNALACLYPSLYEGFGLPILEAMRCGAPVVTSDIPVLRETGSIAALYAPPQDPGAWANQISLLLTEPEFRAQQCTLALSHSQQFTWQRTAAAMRALYLHALR